MDTTGNVEGMNLHLPSSKTDYFRAGISIAIARDPVNPFCPVAAMVNYLQNVTHSSPKAPLFIRPGNLPFTRSFVVEQLQSLALGAGLPGNFSGHSFRKGAATWAAQHGLPEETIKALGRWKSDAVQRYITQPDTYKMSLARRLTLTATYTPSVTHL